MGFPHSAEVFVTHKDFFASRLLHKGHGNGLGQTCHCMRAPGERSLGLRSRDFLIR